MTAATDKHSAETTMYTKLPAIQPVDRVKYFNIQPK